MSTYDTSRLHKLVRTLSKRRDLAAHLKSIVLYTNLEADAIKPSLKELIAKLEVILPIAAGDSWFHTKLATGLHEGVYNVQGILLLLLADRLEVLTIVSAELTAARAASPEVPLQYHFDHLVSSLISWATLSGQKALSKVHMTISHGPQDDDPVAFPGHFMTLPNINTLCATFAFSLRQFWSNDGQSKSPITRIQLDHCMLSTRQVSVIIKACVSLLELDVQWDALKLSEGLYSALEVDVTLLQPALQQHSKTLKTLRLVFSTAKPDVRHSDFQGPLGSLRSFTALESLELDECLLFGKKVQWMIKYWRPTVDFDDLSDFLPVNLSHFTFRTRKGAAEFLHVLVFLSTILPASLRSLDMLMNYESDPLIADYPLAEAVLQGFLTLDQHCPSFYVRRNETGFVNLGPEVEFSLRDDDGVHAAVEKLKAVNGMGEIWKSVEEWKDEQSLF